VWPQTLPSVDPDAVDGLVADGWGLLDVRTQEEWVAGRIRGALHIPLDEVIARADEIPDRVVCICAVGGRSARVTQYLNATGHEAVNLEGGVHAWAARGRPLEVG
jgi:rhodanese-related sulfurtransferase